MVETVGVAFYDSFERDLTQHAVNIPTGGGSGSQRLRIACQDIARDRGYSHWAQFDLSQHDWVIFRFPREVSVPGPIRPMGRRRIAEFAKRMPTRESAEMWMLHDED